MIHDAKPETPTTVPDTFSNLRNTIPATNGSGLFQTER
jgi:hypothetical protein